MNQLERVVRVRNVVIQQPPEIIFQRGRWSKVASASLARRRNRVKRVLHLCLLVTCNPFRCRHHHHHPICHLASGLSRLPCPVSCAGFFGTQAIPRHSTLPCSARCSQYTQGLLHQREFSANPSETHLYSRAGHTFFPLLDSAHGRDIRLPLSNSSSFPSPCYKRWYRVILYQIVRRFDSSSAMVFFKFA